MKQYTNWAIRYDAPYRYLVRSQTKSHDRYLVDLSTCECQCDRYKFNIAPLIRDADWKDVCHLNEEKLCFHLRIASNQFWEDHARDICNSNAPFCNIPPILLEKCKHPLSLTIAKILRGTKNEH